MILREWRAEVRRDKLDAYVAYVRDTGLAHYAGPPATWARRSPRGTWMQAAARS